MMELSEQQRNNLRDDWGMEAKNSEYSIGDQLRYKKDGSTWNGTIMWCAAPSPSTVEGHSDLPMRYICERSRWRDSIPDVVYSKDIISQEPEEPTLEKCKYCQSWHVAGTSEQCPKRPIK